MIIRGDANNAGIELSEAEGLLRPAGSEYYLVTLRENQFEVTGRVYAFDPHVRGLASFFAELAEQWKGWDGLKTWTSLEGEFELECSHDRVGHVTTKATIRSNPYGNGWTGEISFDIAAGSLKEIAAGVDRFFADRKLERKAA